MLPLPPTRFSTTTGWPSDSESFGARMRPTRSGPPPGGKGTSRWMAREGYCATASQASSANTSTSALERIARLADAVQVHFPDAEVAFAGRHHGVLHVQLPREA